MIYTADVRPFAKQRPRVTKRGTYMNPAYTARKKLLGWIVRGQHTGGPLTGPLRVCLEFAFKGKGPRADADNLAGGVLDALNGVLWVDDSQIVSLSATVTRGAYVDRIRVQIDTAEL